MDKQDSLPHRIHRLYGQFNVLSRTSTIYDLRISIVYTNINNRSPAVCRRVLTSFIQPSVEYGMGLVNLRKGEQVAVDKAWLQILRKMLSMPAAASGSAILKVLGVPPMSFRASKPNAGFMARIYDAQPDALTPLVEDKRDCNARRISQGV